MHALTLRWLPGELGIARLEAGAPVPAWWSSGDFCTVTRTSRELSVVCEAGAIPTDVRHEPGWRAFHVASTLPFDMTGVLASLTAPLAHASVPIFAISTFDTDYVLVRAAEVDRVTEILRAAGHRFDEATPCA